MPLQVILRVFREIGQFACHRIVQFYHLHNCEINYLSIMGPVNYFGLVVQEISQNNYIYLKTNFENSEIRDFVPTF